VNSGLIRQVASLGGQFRTIFFIDNVNKDTEKIYTIIKPMDNSEEDEDIV
jgi:hypothetical protein